jgi:uncharacterized PurR-regulated membrane protein YhhQ (DUF165 family)
MKAEINDIHVEQPDRARTIGLVALYLAAIVAANLIVARFGPSATVIVAFLLIGLDITARDRLHEAWRGRNLWIKMAALIAGGSVLSWLLNRDAGPIALASFAAFAASGAADALTYHALRERAWMVKVNGSNMVSAALDSLIFPTLAFGTLLPWIVLGQFAAKVAGGAVWALILKKS